jgi:hypothetical protein
VEGSLRKAGKRVRPAGTVAGAWRGTAGVLRVTRSAARLGDKVEVEGVALDVLYTFRFDVLGLEHQLDAFASVGSPR